MVCYVNAVEYALQSAGVGDFKIDNGAYRTYCRVSTKVSFRNSPEVEFFSELVFTFAEFRVRNSAEYRENKVG